MRPNSTILVIQYLRGIAAVMVVLYHTTMMTAVAPLFPFHFGKSGVDLFFVISGFVMWTTTAGRSRDPLSFWRARILRIAPLYWLATTIFIAALIAMPGAAHTARVLDWAHILKSYMFIPAVDPGIGGISPIYSIGWTLQFEMFFYFVFGLCMLIGTLAIRAAAIVMVFAGLVAIGWLVQPDSAVLATYTSPMLLEFVAGVAVAIGRHRLARLPGAVAGTALLSGFALLAADQYLTGSAATLAATAIGATLIVAAALAFEPWAAAHPAPLLRVLGDASYSIYLMHPMLQRVAFIALMMVMKDGIHTTTDLLIYSLIAMLAGTAGGIVCYYLIEKRLVIRRALRPASTSAVAN